MYTHRYFLGCDIAIQLQSKAVCFLFVFRVGADVDVSIEDLSLSGRVQIVFEMDHLVPFPHMKSVSVTFLEK